ncbi:branched-chain amino acid ABC transporter ATP-binding protein/permease [Streptomyces sp. P9-A4]|uniref:branched-chain amino acid ABC transporter ATP-binding protein/permease n=1 Tax=Streptomyces sp. P9-A4 TaxID=3072285 RepID=UPI002FCB0836
MTTSTVPPAVPPSGAGSGSPSAAPFVPPGAKGAAGAGARGERLRRILRVVLPAATVAGLLAAPFGLDAFALATLTLGLCHGLFAYGLDLSWGRAGLLSVGHAAFFGLGAYAVALAQEHELSVSLTVPAAVLAAVAIAIPVVRVGLAAPVPDAPLILLTIGVGLLLQRAATTLTPVTGGTNGLSVSGTDVVTSYYFTLGAVACVVGVCALFLVRGRFGARLIAAARNPERAAQSGVDGPWVRSVAFGASAAVAALAGALYAPVAGLVSPTVFGLGLSTSVLIWLALGGRESTVGPFLGAVAVTVGQQFLGATWQGWYVLALAALFLLVVRLAPGGLTAAPRRLLAGPGPAVRLPASARRAGRGRTRTSDAEGRAGGGDAESAPPHSEDVESTGTDAGVDPLVLSGVRKAFGPVEVLSGVDLTVAPGQCVCLIGPNGAGKSTLLSVVAGQLASDSGTLRIFGTDAARLPVHRRVRLGVGRMFQIPSVLAELSPADNLDLARMDAPVTAELPAEFLDLAEDRVRPAGTLPLADRRRLELAMVLVAAPRLLLLDEPAAGLGPDDARRLTRELREVNRRTGCAMLVVEHDMEIVRELADEVVVLAGGGVLARGPLDTVAADPAVRAAYLGA